MDNIWSLLGYCCPCFPTFATPSISINKKKYTIVRLLGEGGFSYVYLVQTSGNSLFALKKIRCPFGSQDESFKNALKEIRNYHRFTQSKTPYIVKSIDECIVDESDGSKSIYIIMPYFESSLQDIINRNVLNNINMSQDDIISIFTGVCRGVQAMHKCRVYGRNIEDQEDDLLLPGDEDDNDEVGSMNIGVEVGNTELSEIRPFAHRDLKPANVMISAEGLPVLIDLGSCSKARISIKSRQQALSLTDFASQHCTLPYRAPELLDVATNTEITESTDIWSLGCILYACCFGCSPFEKLEIEQGASLNLAISRGKYVIPQDHPYSESLIKIIEECLQLDPRKRPTIDELIDHLLELQL